MTHNVIHFKTSVITSLVRLEVKFPSLVFSHWHCKSSDDKPNSVVAAADNYVSVHLQSSLGRIHAAQFLLHQLLLLQLQQRDTVPRQVNAHVYTRNMKCLCLES